MIVLSSLLLIFLYRHQHSQADAFLQVRKQQQQWCQQISQQHRSCLAKKLRVREEAGDDDHNKNNNDFSSDHQEGLFDAFLSKLDESIRNESFRSFKIYGSPSNSKHKRSTKPSSPGSLKFVTGRLVRIKAKKKTKPKKYASHTEDMMDNTEDTKTTTTTVVLHTTFKYNSATDITKNWSTDEVGKQLQSLFGNQNKEAWAAVASEWGTDPLLLPLIDNDDDSASPNNPTKIASTMTPILQRAVLDTDTGKWELINNNNNNNSNKQQKLKFHKVTASYHTEADSTPTRRLSNNAATPSTSHERHEHEQHDQPKQVPVSPTADFWQALGITDAMGKPKPGMTSKLRQCQKFVEIVAHLLPVPPPTKSSDDTPGSSSSSSSSSSPIIEVTDMGCGRGYLTFALHSYLQQQQQERGQQQQVHSTGVDVRPKLVAELNQIVDNLNMTNLKFEQGTIQQYITLGADNNDNSSEDHRDDDDDVFQIFIALHACDTATDDALFAALRRRAQIIVVAPCCHKQLRPQINQLFSQQQQQRQRQQQQQHPLSDILRHGIYRERTAETVTDSLRALLLELAGYKTRVFEFIGGEHTAKNCMITAVRQNDNNNNKKSNSKVEDALLLRQRIQSLAAFYGVRQQKLAEWMGEPLLLPTNASSADSGAAPSMMSSSLPKSLLSSILSTRNMPSL